MKKAIVIEVLLLFILAVLIAVAVQHWQSIEPLLPDLEYYKKMAREMLEQYGHDRGFADMVQKTNASIALYRTYGIFDILAMLADVVIMVTIALFNFPCFKPLVDKLTAKLAPSKEQRAQRKAERAAAKAEQAATAKQERIEKLQAELDELKKDE
ncbi:MAG: hypothetical protein K2M89_06390 [Clostridiales bacterium]|nr:hypothetical protein [Clostridiales bacterium]